MGIGKGNVMRHLRGVFFPPAFVGLGGGREGVGGA